MTRQTNTRQHGKGAQPIEQAHVADLLGRANAAGRARPMMTEKTAQALDRARLDSGPRPSPLRGSRLTYDDRGGAL